jgi:hypothetical protein
LFTTFSQRGGNLLVQRGNRAAPDVQDLSVRADHPPLAKARGVRRYARSMAYLFRSASAQKSSAPIWVARSTTRGAWFASNASFQRGAKAPAIARLQPGKAEIGQRSGQVVAPEFGKLQKFV